MKTKSMEIVFVVCLMLIAPCLTVNIAFNKPAYQIGVYKNATADKAVDGRYDIDTGNDYYLSVCAYPDTTWRGNGPAIWWVDLEDIYRISNVTVWNTYNGGGYWRMNNFTVELVTQDNTTKQNCGDYTKPEPVSRGDKYTFNCNNKQGRYVYVRRLQSYKEQQYLTLCEVEVEGSLVTTTITTTPSKITTQTSTNRDTSETAASTVMTTTTTTTTTTTITTTSSSLNSSFSARDTESSAGNHPDRDKVITAGSVIAILIVVLVITGVIIWSRKRDSGKSSGYYFSQSTNNGLSSEFNFTSVNSMISTGDEFDIVQPVQDTSKTPDDDEEESYSKFIIPVSEFDSYVKSKKADFENAFVEFKRLPATDHRRYNIAIIDDNKKKNRFRNLYPYDNNRVILNEVNPETDGDYINASFIKGYNNAKDAYIATQGPICETMKDFWRMIWQINANRIVMVTNLVENGQRMCDRYWPEKKRQAEKYGEFTVTVQSVAEYADYNIRCLEITKNDESRSVDQYHFTSWKDKGMPTFGAFTLLNFHRKVHAKDDERKGPLVVHCSAGVGRTGTFIALDMLLQQMLHEKVVDVFSCVWKLREQRMLMVQTLEQYVFLHDALVEAINIGSMAYPCSTLAESYAYICEEENGESKLQKQFLLLCKLKPSEEEENNQDGLLEENKGKNRDIFILPEFSEKCQLYSNTNATAKHTG